MSKGADTTVHYVAKHPATGKVGTIETPLEQVATACTARWQTRPRRTGLPRSVTCEACLDYIAANYKTVAADIANARRKA